MACATLLRQEAGNDQRARVLLAVDFLAAAPLVLDAAETGFLSEGTAFFAGALRLTAAFLAGTALTAAVVFFTAAGFAAGATFLAGAALTTLAILVSITEVDK